MSMDISIIIVNYNTCRVTIDALQTVFASHTLFRYEVILIDNYSSDDSVRIIRELYPDVILIENQENVGFSRANNQGIRIAKGRYVLLLNSDTLIMQDTLETMVHFMDRHPDVGASGCKVLLPDGSLDKTCKRGFPTPLNSFYYLSGFAKLFPRNPRFNQYTMSHLDPDQETPIDSLVGAFMMVRRETFEQVGLLDEAFFMYGEDIDWCYRIKQAGWQIYYYPRTHILHLKGASSRKKPLKITYEFHRAMILFHRKHYHGIYPWPVNITVYVAIYLKLLFEIVYNRIRFYLISTRGIR